MSIDINWPQPPDSEELNESIRRFLNEQLEEVALPNYLQNIHVSNFSLGSIPPDITIRHINDPFPEFYAEEATSAHDFSETESGVVKRKPISKRDQSSNISESLPDHCSDQNDEIESKKHKNDIQFIVELDYKGDITLEVQVDLLVNYPSPGFITLPVKLKVVDLGIHSLAVISHVSKSVYISFLCDINDEELDNFLRNPTVSKNKPTRIDIIRSMRIESEIGDVRGQEGSILRNVGKVEKFLTEMLRNLLRDELAWPGWISLDFNDDDSEEEEEGEEEEEEAEADERVGEEEKATED